LYHFFYPNYSHNRFLRTWFPSIHQVLNYWKRSWYEKIISPINMRKLNYLLDCLPHCPPSRPIPLSLTPPNGVEAAERLAPFIPIIPNSKACTKKKYYGVENTGSKIKLFSKITYTYKWIQLKLLKGVRVESPTSVSLNILFTSLVHA
jgi:hypothetical protein